MKWMMKLKNYDYFYNMYCLIMFVYYFKLGGYGLKRFLLGFLSKKFICINWFCFVDIWN